MNFTWHSIACPLYNRLNPDHKELLQIRYIIILCVFSVKFVIYVDMMSKYRNKQIWYNLKRETLYHWSNKVDFKNLFLCLCLFVLQNNPKSMRGFYISKTNETLQHLYMSVTNQEPLIEWLSFVAFDNIV